jgi:hypothetical protein
MKNTLNRNQYYIFKDPLRIKDTDAGSRGFTVTLLSIKSLDLFRPCLFLRFKNAFEKKFNFFSLLEINIFLVFSDHFEVLISKIIFKK